MKIDYKKGLSNRDLFFVELCRLFFWKRYSNFKKGVECGQEPKWSYKWNICF